MRYWWGAHRARVGTLRRTACWSASGRPSQDSRREPCKGVIEQPRARALGTGDKPGPNPVRVEQKPAPPLQGSRTELGQSPQGSRPGLFCPALSGPRATNHARTGGFETISARRIHTAVAEISQLASLLAGCRAKRGPGGVSVGTPDGGGWASMLQAVAHVRGRLRT